MAAQQQHERQLAVINTDKKNTRFRNILIGTIAAVLVVGGVAGYMVNKSNEESKAKIAAAEQAKKEQEAETAKLKGQLDEQASKVKNLQSAMEAEKDEHKKKLLQAQLEAAKEEQADTEKKLGGGRPGGAAAAPGGDKPPPPKAACTCKSTDPLCDCL
ncbi:MAG: hypothetical protein JNK04_10215 [Myxococcales bacterium]|nr:hypothetical protein [Myxococcales bacterium]